MKDFPIEASERKIPKDFSSQKTTPNEWRLSLVGDRGKMRESSKLRKSRRVRREDRRRKEKIGNQKNKRDSHYRSMVDYIVTLYIVTLSCFVHMNHGVTTY